MINPHLQALENAWEIDLGFLAKLREGEFSRDSYREFLALLKELHFDEHECIPVRMVTLLWYIIPFLEWQKERISHLMSSEEYDRVSESIMNELERILGVPQGARFTVY